MSKEIRIGAISQGPGGLPDKIIISIGKIGEDVGVEYNVGDTMVYPRGERFKIIRKFEEGGNVKIEVERIRPQGK